MISRIFRHLPKPTDAPLITSGGKTLTQREFFRYVEKIAVQIKFLSPSSDENDDFWIISTDHPIRFYALAIALWESGRRIILPTRDYLNGTQNINYAPFTVSISGEDTVSLTRNKRFCPIRIHQEGDTISFSSGSTGSPKGILHRQRHFFQNAHSVAAMTCQKQAVNVTFLKPYLTSAIAHFLVHYLTSSHLIFVDFNKISTIHDLYLNNPHTGMVGSPIHLITGMSYIPGNAVPDLFFSSGDFISGSTISKIFERFPDTVFYNVYGLAELAGRFFINIIRKTDTQAEYESLGTPIQGCRYRFEKGELQVSSDFLFLGYIINDMFSPSYQWHPSGDLVRHDEQRDGLFLYGRTNDEVKVMGNKVSLKYIENKIRNILNHDTALIIATPHPVFGNILSLLLNTDFPLKRNQLIRKLREALTLTEIPHQFLYIENIPFTQSLKIDRNKIAEQLPRFKAIS